MCVFVCAYVNVYIYIYIYIYMLICWGVSFRPETISYLKPIYKNIQKLCPKSPLNWETL